MTTSHQQAEAIETKYLKQDARRRKQMKVSGKQVFQLKKIISSKDKKLRN